MARMLNIGERFYRDGDSATHTVLAYCEDGMRVLVRREGWGLARAFTYFMDARWHEGLRDA